MALFLLPWTVCTVAFGWAVARRWLAPVVEPAVTVVTLPAVLAPLIWASIVLPVGGAWTALAGNPPINGSDEDVIHATLTIPVAVVLGRLLRRLPPDRPLRRRTRSTAASPPAQRPRPLLVPPGPA
ncbi:hypothetical protein [Couchioplanes caeruleus]|uniref:hypothetical protein n=1 Tax=Couchioplanes caeruleus TaxID=56438 RepID=UPI0011602531|nr:hypothetical protein [Couchioplanes caeruleus]